jgi:hypothetical protein
MSRSPAVAAAALTYFRGCALAEALALVLPTASGDLNRALLTELRAAIESD